MVDVLTTSLDTQVLLDRLETIIRLNRFGLDRNSLFRGAMVDFEQARVALESLKLDIEIHLRRAGVPFR